MQQLSRYARQVWRSKFARSVAVVASGTAGAQAITMAFTPIITRLYGPETFGVLGTFTAILAVLMPLTALSYPIAIVLPKRDADAVELAKLSIRIALITSLITAVILMAFKTQIVSTFSLQTVESFIMLLPLAMVFSVALAIMSQWVIRKSLFKLKARVAVLQALWLNSAKAGVGLISPVAAVLIVLTILGSALHALMLWTGMNKTSERKSVPAVNMAERPATSRELAWKHRDFAYYRTPQVILNAISQSFPIIVLAALFGPEPAGFYALGRMVMSMPSALIGKSVSDVFYPRLSKSTHNKENTYKLIVKACSALFIAGLVPYGLVIIFGPVLFSFVFGPQWQVAGQYAQWIAMFLYAGFLTGPCISAMPVFGRQLFFLTYELVSTVLRVGAIFLGYMIFKDDLYTVASVCVIGFFIKLSLIPFTLRFAAKNDSKNLENQGS